MSDTADCSVDLQQDGFTSEVVPPSFHLSCEFIQTRSLVHLTTKKAFLVYVINIIYTSVQKENAIAWLIEKLYSGMRVVLSHVSCSVCPQISIICITSWPVNIQKIVVLLTIYLFFHQNCLLIAVIPIPTLFNKENLPCSRICKICWNGPMKHQIITVRVTITILKCYFAFFIFYSHRIRWTNEGFEFNCPISSRFSKFGTLQFSVVMPSNLQLSSCLFDQNRNKGLAFTYLR